MALPSVDIVIVNWNSGDQLRQCLRSIVSTKKNNFKLASVVIVDNASYDESLEGVENFDLPVILIKNRCNLGFAKGCNQGGARAAGDYILFLNPDAALFEESLTKSVDFMESEQAAEYGICGVQLVDENGNVSRTCARFPTLSSFMVKTLGLDRMNRRWFKTERMKEWDHRQSREVDQLMGAFFFIRTKLYRRLGGFDERFFVYYEEVDLSKRMREIGYRSFYLSEARVFHKGCGTSDQIRGKRLAYNIRSRLLYGSKHFSRIESGLLVLVTLVLEPIARLAHLVATGRAKEMGEVLSGYFQVYKGLPSLVGTYVGMNKPHTEKKENVIV